MQKTNDDMNLMNTEKLADIFEIAKLCEKYIEYTPFKDATIGFSIQREYPANIRYKPPLTSDGRPDRVALIHVACINVKGKSKTQNLHRTPIFFSIGLYSRYLSNHFDYNFDEKNCPTEESIEGSRSTPKPLDLQSADEYVYNHNTGTLQNAKGKVTSGEKILDELFEKHCSTVHLMKGLSLRWRVSSRKVLVKVTDMYIQLNKWLLKSLFGRSLEPGDPASGIWKTYKREDLKLLKTDSIIVFNYKAPKNVIITYCFILVAIFLAAHFFRIKSILSLPSNNLSAVPLGLVVLWVLDYPIPFLILLLINIFIHLKLKLLLMEFKV